MRPGLLRVIASLAVALAFVSTGVAQAAWMKSGSGSGATVARSLVAPVATATRSTTAPTSAIDLSWTTAGQPSGTSYEVRRDGSLIGCTSSPCTDSGLAPGTTYGYVVTAKLGQWTKDSAAATGSTAAASAPATSYSLAATPASTTAGSSTSVVITARRADGTIDTGYTGSKNLTWGGAAFATSPGGMAAGAAAGVTFTDGVSAAVPVTLTTAGTGLTLTVTTGALSGSATMTVAPAAPARLAMTSTTTGSTGSATQTTRSCLFGCTLTALGSNATFTTSVSVTDSYGNVVNNLGGSGLTVDLSRASDRAGTLAPTSLTIPASGPATSTGATTSTEGTPSYTTTVTAVPRTPATYTQVAATFSK